VEPVTATIEPDLVYPLLRGRDVQRWRATPSAHLLMVQDPKTRRGIDEETMQVQYPRTWAYLKNFEKILRQRSVFIRYFTRGKKKDIIETGNFYSMFGVGEYLFSNYKVVWREVSNELEPSFIGNYHDRYLMTKNVMPSHTIVYIPVEDINEAYYLEGVLNCSPCLLVVKAYIVMHPSPHIMKYLKIPNYEQQNDLHLRIAKCSQEAHLLKYENKEREFKEKIVRIDNLAAQLWGITAAELKDIQWNLADLKGGGRKTKQADLFDQT
jgi:hypothetical protein